MGTAFLGLFNSYNEIFPDEWIDDWSTSVKKHLNSYSNDPDIMAWWERMRDKLRQEKKVRDVVTGVAELSDGPCLDTNSILYQPEKLLSDSLEPKMTLPKSDKKTIAVGAFPGELWDIFPNITWYDYNYVPFVERIEKDDFSMAIIGECSNTDLKLPIQPKTTTICYQPSIYLSDHRPESKFPAGRNQQAIYNTLREKPVGTPLPDNGFSYRDYNNRFWVFQSYPGNDIVEREENMIYCNGWVLPQYLIRDGYLEVN